MYIAQTALCQGPECTAVQWGGEGAWLGNGALLPKESRDMGLVQLAWDKIEKYAKLPFMFHSEQRLLKALQNKWGVMIHAVLLPKDGICAREWCVFVAHPIRCSFSGTSGLSPTYYSPFQACPSTSCHLTPSIPTTPSQPRCLCLVCLLRFLTPSK